MLLHGALPLGMCPISLYHPKFPHENSRFSSPRNQQSPSCKATTETEHTDVCVVKHVHYPKVVSCGYFEGSPSFNGLAVGEIQICSNCSCFVAKFHFVANPLVSGLSFLDEWSYAGSCAYFERFQLQ